MPIYLYECDSCGVRFERMERMSADPLTGCPECDGHVHRVIQPVGVIFRGSGFYITDNRQVSSPTLAPSKESDKSKDTKDAKDTRDAKDTKDTKDTKDGSGKTSEKKSAAPPKDDG